MWLRAKGFCILDIDAMHFIVDNAFTGYHYAYELNQNVQGRKSETYSSYPDAHTKNKRRKAFDLWFDVNVVPGEGLIEVKRRTCEVTITLDKSIRYAQDKDRSEPPAPQVIYRSSECPPMWVEGRYRLRGGKFVLE